MRDTSFLVPTFRTQIDKLLGIMLTKHNQRFRVYQTIRDPWTQARYYRQSRTTTQIHKKAELFSHYGAGYLADILQTVGAQYGPRVTGAGPGESWHQYASAVDMFRLMPNGSAVWHSRYYAELSDECIIAKLTNGLEFRTPDPYHVQANGARVGDSGLAPMTFLKWEQLALDMYGLVESQWEQHFREWHGTHTGRNS